MLTRNLILSDAFLQHVYEPVLFRRILLSRMESSFNFSELLLFR